VGAEASQIGLRKLLSIPIVLVFPLSTAGRQIGEPDDRIKAVGLLKPDINLPHTLFHFDATFAMTNDMIRPSYFQHQSCNRTQKKRGAAVMEFVIVLPFFLLIIGATVELCSAAFLKQALAISAYEGARVAVRRTGTVENTEAKVRDILAQRGVTLVGVSSAVLVSPDPSTASELDPISVRVRAPISNNTVIPFSWLRLLSSNELEYRVVLRKESVTVVE
jgi:hypothetical protein